MAKTPRITYMGQTYREPRRVPVRYVRRDTGGRFARMFRFSSRTKALVLFFGLIASGALFSTEPFVTSALTSAMYGNVEHAVNQFPATATIARTVETHLVDSLKDDLINDIAQCESSMNAAPFIQYDQNSAGTLKGINAFSLGLVRFKIGTVEQYEKQLYHKDVTDKEAIALLLDDDQTRTLAKDVIFLAGGINNWKNSALKGGGCAVQVDADTRIALIRKLEARIQ